MTEAKSENEARGFRLLIDQVGGLDTYGVALEEINGSTLAGRIVVKASAENTLGVMPALLDAVRASGHPRTILSSGRRTPITLKEEAGVRLGLVLLATWPIVKARRLEEMTEAVAGMTGEETYYWYAKVTGRNSRRLQRALRLFLAEK